MKAVYYQQFQQTPRVTQVQDPHPDDTGVVIKVHASGVCRSDWHGWMGHDTDIKLPHVPGHELAGEIVEVGAAIKCWQAGDRVTLPFVCGCGNCWQCHSGNQQICDDQFQPGFTHWGSFAEYVAINYADTNLVRLPEEMDYVTAASLGCRFITAFRAIVAQGQVSAGQWVAVHGCGGVGLSAVMIADALGAQVIAIDINENNLKLAQSLGAKHCLNAKKTEDSVAAVIDISSGGAHASVDALGSSETCFNSISNLRKQGKHIQVGLMAGDHHHPKIPMEKVIANELEIIGSHGMQAHQYSAMFEMIKSQTLRPEKLIGNTISLAQAPKALVDMDTFSGTGITVINEF